MRGRKWTLPVLEEKREGREDQQGDENPVSGEEGDKVCKGLRRAFPYLINVQLKRVPGEGGAMQQTRDRMVVEAIAIVRSYIKVVWVSLWTVSYLRDRKFSSTHSYSAILG